MARKPHQESKVGTLYLIQKGDAGMIMNLTAEKGVIILRLNERETLNENLDQALMELAVIVNAFTTPPRLTEKNQAR